jgi:hypothetical protein
MKVGARIQCFGKTIHAGQVGEVISDYGNYLVIKPDDQKYERANRNSSYDFKTFQVDYLLVKQLKE